MNGRDIPGFYYGILTMMYILNRQETSISNLSISTDADKKKYFKIQANHAAPPGSQYSKEAVKRKRAEEEVSTHVEFLLSLVLPADTYYASADSTTQGSPWPASGEGKDQEAGMHVPSAHGSGA